MKFTVAFGLGGYEDYMPLAKAADSAGWHGINIPDSIFFPKLTESDYPYNDTEATRRALDGAPVIEPFVAMASMAAVTESLHFYPTVLKVPVRQPLLLAKSLSSLAVMSGNRVGLGAGLSPWKEDFTYNGVEFAPRGKLMDECIEIIRGAMSGDFFEFHGEHYDFGPMKMAPVPDQRVPILFGGHSKPALRRAARLGDGWMSANSDYPSLKAMLEQLNGLRREYGTENKESFELHLIDSHAKSVDDFKRLQDLGATHAGVVVWDLYNPKVSLQEKIDGLNQFADTIISQFD